MGNFLYGGKRPTNITYQGKDVQILKYNGVTVCERFAPVTKTFYFSNSEEEKTEDYIAPAGATVMCVKYKYLYNIVPNTIPVIEYKSATCYIKINQQHKFMLRFYHSNVNPPHGGIFKSSVIQLLKSADDNNNDVVAMTIDEKCKMELSFSKEINEHDFSDNTSDHKHLDLTK